MDDSDIIAAVRAGERETFGALVERYQRRLYYFVVGKVADDTEAKDIVQELPLQAIGEQLGRGSEAVRLWLYRIRQRLAECVRRRLRLELP